MLTPVWPRLKDRVVKFEKESGASTKSTQARDVHRVVPKDREPRTQGTVSFQLMVFHLAFPL